MVGSAIGSQFTRISDTWADVNPLTASLVGPWSLGGAIVLAAFAPLGRRLVVVVSVALLIAMIVMWWAFATNESSTSSLVFTLGWLIGVPVAAGLGVLASRRARP